MFCGWKRYTVLSTENCAFPAKFYFLDSSSGQFSAFEDKKVEIATKINSQTTSEEADEFFYKQFPNVSFVKILQDQKEIFRLFAKRTTECGRETTEY